MLSQSGLQATSNRHQRHALAAEHGQDHCKLSALATVRNSQHHVNAFDHTQVAVAGLTGVYKHGGRAGGCQSGGNLAADVTTFAYAHHHHPALASQHELDCLRKLWPHPACQC